MCQKCKMCQRCKWIHKNLGKLPIRSCHELGCLPPNGIYFFYENGEIWGHDGKRKSKRIVRVKTHKKQGGFEDRIKKHLLISGNAMNFGQRNRPPHDISIFRKRIGRAILGRNHPYLEIWNNGNNGNRRNINFEKKIERKITKRLRGKFSFRFIIIEKQKSRMGLEQRLIGTIARCPACSPSNKWFGKRTICDGKLWQTQHVKDDGLVKKDKATLSNAIKKTNNWIKNQQNHASP